MPKSVQGKAKQLIHEMYLAPTRKAALAAYGQFISSYQTKFPIGLPPGPKDRGNPKLKYARLHKAVYHDVVVQQFGACNDEDQAARFPKE